MNLKREKTNPNLKYNNIIGNSNNITNKYKSDKNTIENEENQEKRKNDYMNDLIQNGIAGFAKELEAKKKKISENKKSTERKLDYLNK